jgi:hypothetical protein
MPDLKPNEGNLARHFGQVAVARHEYPTISGDCPIAPADLPLGDEPGSQLGQ